jgi:guanylate kinase
MSRMLIFTAPSGAGKTTIVRHLLNTFPDQLAFSVSATTRPRRTHEVDGKDYHFLSVDEFKARVAAGDFVEWEEVYDGLFYGTLHEEIQRSWAAGKHLVFDIDVKGAINLKQAYPEESLAIFIKPPTPAILFDRLRKRQTEDEDSLRQRIARAAEELTYEQRFDWILTNDDLLATLLEAESITQRFITSGHAAFS